MCHLLIPPPYPGTSKVNPRDRGAPEEEETDLFDERRDHADINIDIIDAKRKTRMRPGDYDPNMYARRRRSITLYDAPLEVEVEPLDFMWRYCIISEPKRKQYLQIFSALDVDRTGLLDTDSAVAGLKSVNNELISDDEINYVQTVMRVCAHANKIDDVNVPCHFELFAIMAALSEQVHGLDEMVKDCIHQMDFEALEKKIVKSKDLFVLNADEYMEMHVDDLNVMLEAGRIEPEEKDVVIGALAKDDTTQLNFFDFVSYLPLFVNIHDDITKNTLKMTRRSLMPE